MQKKPHDPAAGAGPRVVPIARADAGAISTSAPASVIERVVAGGYCIGCGACAIVDPRIAIEPNRYGDLVARLPPEVAGDPLQASAVCPFNDARDETALARDNFPDAAVDSPVAGRYEKAYQGYSVPYRAYGSSGGVGTHTLARMLEAGRIDHVVCVGPSPSGLAEYQVVDSLPRLLDCATSFYYPITLRQVLRIVRETPGRYAITGVPCFHKAIRLLKERDPVLRERIVLQVGLVCGQMKSAHYAEYLARRTGMPADARLERISFRAKAGTPRADDYNFIADWRAPDGAAGHGVLGARAIGFNWGMSYFKPKACDFCDDVYAECADIAIMDAWLPGVVEDARGTSLVIARSPDMTELMEAERASGALHLADSDIAALMRSQEGGLRHRRQGLRFRLWLAERRARWYPRKRVLPSLNAGLFVAVEMLFRMALRRRSRAAYLRQRAAGDGVAVFAGAMKGPEFVYKVFSKVRRVVERRWPARAASPFDIDSGRP